MTKSKLKESKPHNSNLTLDIHRRMKESLSMGVMFQG